ncbi:tetratricopeptide repeat protein, partial [Nocardia sp. NPDC003345]
AKLGSRYRGIEIRAGADPEHAADRADIPRRRPPWRRTSGVGARAEYERALTLLNATDDPDAVPQAVERLRKAWWRLPRADAANQVRVLTALAVAYIRQGRLDAAQDRLELAALRARDAGDDDGWARAQELTAVVHWTRGEPRAALRCWQRALTIYRDLSDADGIGRTLHNIGAAALKAPEHGDLLLGGVEAPAAMEVLRYAHSWLAEAARRDPAPASARQYTVDAAAARGGAVAPPMGRWPLEVRDVGGPDPG